MFRSDTKAEIFLRKHKIEDVTIRVNGVYNAIGGHTISTILELYEKEMENSISDEDEKCEKEFHAGGECTSCEYYQYCLNNPHDR